MHPILRLIAGGALIVCCGVAVACSSGKSTPVPVGTSTQLKVKPGSVVPTLTPTRIPAPQETAVAAGGKVGLQDYTDHDHRYTAKLPAGWALQETPNQESLSLAGSPLSATLVIFCAPGITLSQLEQADQQTLDRFNSGKIDFANGTAMQVAGQPAQLIRWHGGLGGTKTELDHTSVYFTGNGCAWRILMTTFPGTNMADLRPVLDNVLASFKFS